MNASPPTRTAVTTPSGIDLMVWEWGGPGPVVLLHHGTGFCAGVWRRVAERLASRFHVVAFDARGHGESSKPAAGYRWDTFSEDLRALGAWMKPRRGPIALGVGHSFGGAVMMHAAQKEPGLFGALALIEPVLLTAERYKRQGVRADGTNPLSTATRIRTVRYPSREAAAAHLGQTRLFASWDPDVFDDYLGYGFTALPGGEVELKCPPAIEAQLFELGPNEDWFARELLGVPTLIQRATGGWFSEEHYAPFRGLFQRATYEVIEAGHLVPMELPERTAGRIVGFAEEIGV
jgi:pimeloyl-ACP methyl ester carboxylesterase